MGIKTVETGSGERPGIFCDGCGEEITSAGDGNAQWDHDEFYFSHKACFHLVDERFHTPCSLELRDFIWYLAHNLGVDTRKPSLMVQHFSSHGETLKSAHKRTKRRTGPS